ncbi:MAG: arsenate reductase [Marinibacterium sp.]|nr:arsenate reductase [Marinibacterium sp.]
MTLFGLKTCDTCRKALRALDQVTYFDVRKDGVPDEILETAYARFGDRLINTRSTTWRALDANSRELPALELLRKNPTLMKRPLIISDGEMYLGWGADEKAALGAA